MRSAHRVRVSFTGITRRWAVDCTCGSHTEWHFWDNAMRRADKHAFMPGVWR